MKKIILPDIQDIYYADGDSGMIKMRKGGKYVELTSYVEEVRKEPRVSLKKKDGTWRKLARGYLIIGAYEGFKDKKLFVYRFRNEDPADTRIKNMEWVERFGFIDSLSADEYRLFREKIDRISLESCIEFSRYFDKRLKRENGLAGYSPRARKKFFERLLSVNVQRIKDIEDAVSLSFVNIDKT